ncbi:MAG: DUF6526 family protein [Flavitalea sp.]
MDKQKYSNHVRYYTPHHFIFYPIILTAFTAAIRMMFKNQHESLIWGAFALIIFLIGWLSFMLRQHYALEIQNRVVRLELRLRYYQLTNQRLEQFEDRLSFKQIAALRFAPDEELPSLVERCLKENLSPVEIKKAIKTWLPDHMRV